MKKLIWAPAMICAVMLALVSCGGGEEKKAAEKSETPAAPAADNSMVVAVAGKGKELIAGQDCATCHKETEKVIGPSFKEIAAKYPATDANIATLADKIIKGGSGNWGEIPMAPHAGVPKEDAVEMVKYILSVK